MPFPNKQATDLKKKMTELYSAEGEAKVFLHYMEEVYRLTECKKDGFYNASFCFQQYNAEKHKELNKLKQAHKRISKRDIPFVTQFFTPEHIAKYVVQNSLGNLLYEGGYKLTMPYFTAGDNVKFGVRKLNTESLRILDPAVGTGNLLKEAVELMTEAYRLDGVAEDKIGEKLAANFVGLDIDERAVEACKKLMKREFNVDFKLLTLRKPQNDKLVDLSEIGSVAIFDKAQLTAIRAEAPEYAEAAEALSGRYDIVIMNPPYLAMTDCGKELEDYVKKNYKDYKTDLFSAFIGRGLAMLKNDGYLGVVCPYNWMFTRQYLGVRRAVCRDNDLIGLAMLPYDGYKYAVVYLSCFAVRASKTDADGVYIKLEKGKSDAKSLSEACKNPLSPYRYIVPRDYFDCTPYNALTFWLSSAAVANYRKGKLSDFLEIRQGMATGNNAYYLKNIAEVPPSAIAYEATSIEDFDNSGKQYALYNKGGKYRKWYGNVNYVIRFDKLSREALAKQGNNMPSRQYYFKPCITWTLVSSKGCFGARISDNSVFDVGGSCGFPKRKEDIFVLLAYLCSSVATYYLNAQNPTINCQVGDIKNLPYIEPSAKERAEIERLTKENIQICRDDWNEYAADNSPDKDTARRRWVALKANEARLNAIFAALYGVPAPIEVKDNEITLKWRVQNEDKTI